MQPGERLGRECRRYGSHAAAGDQHELPPVGRVGDRAAQQPDGEDRHNLRHANSADRQWRVSELIDLEDDGKASHGTAHAGHGRPGPQAPERDGLT